MENAVVEAKEDFFALEDEITKETGILIKYDLTDVEEIDLFIITEMYQRDKDFTTHIREALVVYMALKREELNL